LNAGLPPSFNTPLEGGPDNSIQLRLFTTSDSQALANILEAVWGEDVGAISYYDFAENASALIQHIVVAVTEDKPVGFGHAALYATHPSHVFVHINIHPAYQRLGIGKKIYQELVTSIKVFGGYPYLTATYEDQPHAIAFLRHCGFREQMRTYLPRLEVAQCSLDFLKDAEQHILSVGYQIQSMAALASDPGRDAKLADLLFDLYARIHPDNPPGEAMYEQRKEIFVNSLNPEATFIAVQDGVYAAIGYLLASQRPQAMDIGLFGVAVEHQNYALELALTIKKYEIAYAKQREVSTLVAEVDSTDELGMAILAHLPFQHRPAWITFVNDGESG